MIHGDLLRVIAFDVVLWLCCLFLVTLHCSSVF